jgi:hypothetical protein
MSKSLIRKNQLHPDITDLVGQYGSGYFISISSSGDLINGLEKIISQDFESTVKITSDQTISGIKTFTQRPVLNGSGLATTGDLTASIIFSGNRPITANVIGFKDVAPGGNDVITFLNNVFYPFISATISLNSFGVRELGVPFNNIPFTVNITQNSETGISNLQFLNNGSVFQTFAGTPSFGSNTYSSTLSLTANSNLAASVRINNNNNNPQQITGLSTLVQFEAPTFAGSGIDNLQNNPVNIKAILSGQNSLGGNNGKTVMQEPSSFQVQVYTNNNWFYIVYPSGWGDLSRIANPQLGDFNINTDFTQGFVTLTLDNNVTTHPYRYYKRTLPTTLTNYPVIYYF